MNRNLPAHSLMLFQVLVAATALVAVAAIEDSRALTVRVVSPSPMQKARPGESVPVLIDIFSAAGDLIWEIDLLDAVGRTVRAIVTGTGPVLGAPVAFIEMDGLQSGELYRVRVRARDSVEQAVAETSFRLVDPAYQLIPMDAGELSRRQFGSWLGDGSGDLLLIGGQTQLELIVVERKTGRRGFIELDLGSTFGTGLSSDGSVLFYQGTFPREIVGTYRIGIGYQVLATGELGFVKERSFSWFAVGDDGSRMAYAAIGDDIERLQYFLYDRPTGVSTQLTHTPDAVGFGGQGPCSELVTSRPMISGDGQTVAILTASTLDLVPAVPGDPCRLFVYSAEESQWRLVYTFSASVDLFVPAMTADAELVSFVLIEALPEGGQRGGPAGVDVRSGELLDPLVDVGPFSSFDASVTREGNGVVISSQADLDPRVGNADHNMELFFYDRATGEIEQISETTGGIGSPPTGCPSYEPYVNNDGSVVLFGLARVSVAPCLLAGIQRDEATGFAGRMVRAIRKRKGNNLAEFEPIADLRVSAGGTLRLDLAASDPDGDPISFFIQPKGESDIPKGSVVVDSHDGTGWFEWATRLEDTGEYEFRVAAFDEGGGVVLRDFTISVLPSVLPTPTVADPSQPGGGGSSECCGGDCDSDGSVTVAELIGMVRMSLTGTADDTCRCREIGDDQPIGVADILAGVRNLFEGCP